METILVATLVIAVIGFAWRISEQSEKIKMQQKNLQSYHELESYWRDQVQLATESESAMAEQLKSLKEAIVRKSLTQPTPKQHTNVGWAGIRKAHNQSVLHESEIAEKKERDTAFVE